MLLHCICCAPLSAPTHQIDVLQRRQPQLLVATPGRLLDLLDSGVVAFDRTSLVVLDEADKMLSVGFEPQLQRLQALLLRARTAAAVSGQKKKQKKGGSKKHGKQGQSVGVQQAADEDVQQQEQQQQGCQVLLFSATLPQTVRQTADAWLLPDHESVSCSAGADSISRTITQVGV